MEKIFRCRLPKHSLFDFREIFERYAGLSTAVIANISDGTSPFDGLGTRTSQESKLNAISLDRRNQRRLEFHHIQARNDLLSLAALVADDDFDRAAVKLGTVILDSELVESLNMRQSDIVQSKERSRVIGLEKEVWSSETPGRSIASRI
ncbi:MAG: hypothetical protein ACRD43_02015 [Pyrinomonadaceae bacterium]